MATGVSKAARDPGLETRTDRRRARLRSGVARVVVAGALLAGLLTLATAAQGRSAVSLSLDVTFTAGGTISVTLPDGTPVGSTSGTPTVIPAGYYTVVFSGPLTDNGLPYFHLTGPAADVLNNLNEGGVPSATDTTYLLPSSTYTWTNDAIPGVVYTFVTSANVLGTPPAAPAPAAAHSTAASQDIVGSAIVRFRGLLTGSVSAAGKLALAYKGRSVRSLPAGRYTITVGDASATNGFMLEKTGDAVVGITGVAFTGKRAVTVDLTAGRWHFSSRLVAKKTYSVIVT